MAHLGCPLRREGGHGGGTPADQQLRLPRGGSQGSVDQGDARMTAVEKAEQRLTIGLGFHGYHPRAQPAPQPGPAAHMGANIKTEVAGPDKITVEAGQPPATPEQG